MFLTVLFSLLAHKWPTLTRLPIVESRQSLGGPLHPGLLTLWCQGNSSSSEEARAWCGAMWSQAQGRSCAWDSSPHLVTSMSESVRPALV